MLHLERVISADVKTIDDIVALGHEFNKALGESVSFDFWKAEELVALAAAEDSDYYLAVLKEEEKVVGLLGGALHNPLFSTTTLAIELLWYVQPEYRGSIKAVKMVKEFEAWAKSQGATMITMIAQEDSGSDPSKVYERLGYKLTERTFTKEL